MEWGSPVKARRWQMLVGAVCALNGKYSSFNYLKEARE